MSIASKLFVALFAFAQCALAQAPSSDRAKPTVVRKDEGEMRTRRPRGTVASPSSDFVIKISPKTVGSKHLLVFTEQMLPGAAIPKHRHHGEEEILLIQTGTAHVWLGDKEYDASAGAVIFIPSETWISLKNTGKEPIQVVAVWNEPSFEEMLRCGSVPKGQEGQPLSPEDVRACYHDGGAELDLAPPATSPDKKQ